MTEEQFKKLLEKLEELITEIKLSHSFTYPTYPYYPIYPYYPTWPYYNPR